MENCGVISVCDLYVKSFGKFYGVWSKFGASLEQGFLVLEHARGEGPCPGWPGIVLGDRA